MTRRDLLAASARFGLLLSVGALLGALVGVTVLALGGTAGAASNVGSTVATALGPLLVMLRWEWVVGDRP